jgi:hypothetical protein
MIILRMGIVAEKLEIMKGSLRKKQKAASEFLHIGG